MYQSDPSFVIARTTARRFYRELQSKLSMFATALPENVTVHDRDEYVLLMGYRLVVLYFLQKQGLLDQNMAYLPQRLQLWQQHQGPDRFYQHYLLPLFARLANDQRQVQLDSTLFGVLPDVALPIFAPQRMDQQRVSIPDHVFYELFTMFEKYRWKIVRTPLKANELDPDILAYIFERHINKKQAGAYYTEADVTDYIARNTIIPYLLDFLQEYYTNTLVTPCYWRLLYSRPERYIYQSIQSPDHLPGEHERDYLVRQHSCRELVQHLKNGDVKTVESLIACNLDIELLLLESIASIERVDLLLQLYTCLKHMTILDPTCGSGAFLFAAQTLLTSLYRACLERLHVCTASLSNRAIPLYQGLLTEMAAHPDQHSFIQHMILTRNLYGVDLMPEAVDICVLRLYFSRIEAISAIRDIPAATGILHNIRCGNVLAGALQPATHHDNVLQDMTTTHQVFDWHTQFPVIAHQQGFAVIIGNPPFLEHSKVKQSYSIAGYEEKSCGNLYAAVIERALTLCHPTHSYLGLIVPLSMCNSLRFSFLRQTLRASLSPLWLASFEIFPSRLFSDAFQRLTLLLGKRQTVPMQQLYTTKTQRWQAIERPHLFTSLRYTQVRQTTHLFDTFPRIANLQHETILHKLFQRADQATIASYLQKQNSNTFVFYQEATNYWIKAACHIPFYQKDGNVMRPPHSRVLYFADEEIARSIMALLNSSLFYLWFATYADGFHLSHTLIKHFPLNTDLWNRYNIYNLSYVLEENIRLHARRSTRHTRPDGHASQKPYAIELEEYQTGYAKPILDQIDEQLAAYYGFTAEELDYIVHFDSKHRLAKKRKR